MEKMIWAKPEMNEMAFAANEYVAACGDSGTVYSFECNAPSGYLDFYQDYQVTEDQTTAPTDFSGKNLFFGSDGMVEYEVCNDSHSAESTGDFYWGFIDYNNNKIHDTTAYATDDGKSILETVIVWLECVYRDGYKVIQNGHATASLDMSSWETEKS